MHRKILAFFAFAALTAHAQQPQTQTAPIYSANAKYVQGVGPGYWPTAGSGLTLNLSAGTADCAETIVTYAGGTLSLTASATNYVYLNSASSCVPAFNTTGFVAGNIPVATIVTGISAITSISDDRTIQKTSAGEYLPLGGGTLTGPLTLPGITLNTNTSFWNSQAPGMLQNADNGCWEAWAIDTAGNPPYRDLAVAECLQLSTTTPASETDTLYIRSHKPTALIAANSGNVARCGHDACIGDTTLYLDRVMALGVPNTVANSGYILVGTFTNGDREQLGYPFATASGNNGATLTGVTALTYNHNAGELVTSLNDTADNTSFGYSYDNTAGDANMTSGVIYGANSAPLWAVGTPYTQGNIVYWPANLPYDVYVALQSTTGNTPTTSPTYWQYLGPATEPDMTGLSIRGAGNSQSFSGDILNDLYGGTEMLRIDSNGQITARSNATSRTLSSITITSGAKTLVSSNSNVTTLAAAVTANAHWISLAAPITLDSNNVVTIDTSTSQEQCLVRYGNGTASMYLSRCMFVHGNITSNNATILAHSAGATITASDFTYNDLEQARYVTGSGIPAATYITAVADGLHATMSQNATANSSISLTIYAASLDLLTTASVPLVFFTGYNGGSGAITDVCTAFGAAANIACTYTLEADTSGSINASVAAQSSQGSVVLEENGSSANATLQTNNTSPILIGTNCTIGSTSCVGLKVDGSNNVVMPNVASSPNSAPVCPNGTGGAFGLCSTIPVANLPTIIQASQGGNMACAMAADTTINAQNITGGTSTGSSLTFNTAVTTPLYIGQLINVTGYIGANNTLTAQQLVVTGFVAGTSITVTTADNPGNWSSGGTWSLSCGNQSTDAIVATPYSFASRPALPAFVFGTYQQSHAEAAFAQFASASAPTLGYFRLYYNGTGGTKLWANNNLPAAVSSQNGITGSFTWAMNALSYSNPSVLLNTVMTSGLLNTTSGATAFVGAPGNPPPFDTSSAHPLVFAVGYTATGVVSGTYTSGGSITGSSTQTCTLTSFNNSSTATATVALTGTNTIAGGTALVITSRGAAATAAPTSATLGNGTATCSGSATIATVLGGAAGNAILLNSLTFRPN